MNDSDAETALIVNKLFRTSNLIHLSQSEFELVRKPHFKLAIPNGTFIMVDYKDLYIFMDFAWTHLKICNCNCNYHT